MHELKQREVIRRQAQTKHSSSLSVPFQVSCSKHLPSCERDLYLCTRNDVRLDHTCAVLEQAAATNVSFCESKVEVCARVTAKNGVRPDLTYAFLEQAAATNVYFCQARSRFVHERQQRMVLDQILPVLFLSRPLQPTFPFARARSRFVHERQQRMVLDQILPVLFLSRPLQPHTGALAQVAKGHSVMHVAAVIKTCDQLVS